MLRHACLSAALTACAAPALAQEKTGPATLDPPAAAPFVRPPAPGQLVAVGKRRLHIQCQGQGPAVVIEAGLSQYTANSTYRKVMEQAAPFARVCIYDRAGLGWSDPDPRERTHDAMVADLHALIGKLRLKGKVVLVGHSMGGLIVRRYAALHPRKVAGIVLADATPESTLFNPAAVKARQAIVAQIDKGLAAAKNDQPVVPMPPSTPAEVRLAFTPPVLRALREEYRAIDRVPAPLQASGYGTLGDLPLVVIRRGKEASPPSEDDLSWRGKQEALAKLSTRGELVVAEKAGHVIPYDQPEAVVAAIRRVIDLTAKRKTAR